MKTKLVIGFLAIVLFLTIKPASSSAISEENFYLYATTGWDYNSNPAQKPNDDRTARAIQGHGGAVYTQNAKLGYRLNPQGPFDVEAMYEYYQYFNMPRVNTLYDSLMHTVTVRPSYLYGSTKFYLPFVFNFTDVQSDKYSNSYLLQPTVFHRYSQEWGFELAMNLSRQYVSAPVAIGEFDRSARSIGFLAGAYYFLDQDKGYVQARFGYDRVGAVGRDWVGSKFLMMVNLLYQATPRLKLNPFLSIGVDPYDFKYWDGVIFHDKRDDTTIRVGAILTYNVCKWVDFNVHYYVTREISNIKLYDYQQHMAGALLSFTYGRP
jgi:hypothetical protein